MWGATQAAFTTSLAHADTKKLAHLGFEARVTLGPSDWELIRA